MKRRRKIDRDNIIPLFRAKCFNRRHMLNSGIIDQDVEATVVLRDAIHGRGGRRPARRR